MSDSCHCNTTKNGVVICTCKGEKSYTHPRQDTPSGQKQTTYYKPKEDKK